MKTELTGHVGKGLKHEQQPQLQFHESIVMEIDDNSTGLKKKLSLEHHHAMNLHPNISVVRTIFGSILLITNSCFSFLCFVPTIKARA